MDQRKNFIDENSSSLSIQLINNISVFAKRVVNITLNTVDVIRNSIATTSYAEINKANDLNLMTKQFMDGIAELLDEFGNDMNHLISLENKGNIYLQKFINPKLLKRIFGKDIKLGSITEMYIQFLNKWYQRHIMQLSKTFLKMVINQIQYMEVKNDQ